MRFAIVTPTYNEIGNIEKLLTRIKDVAAELAPDTFTVFVIDDSSPDGTAKLVQKLTTDLKTQNFDIQLFSRKDKDGLGRAYVYGFTRILSLGTYDYLIQMDADLSHDPQYIHGFVFQAKQSADFVVASRYIPGGGTPDWPWYRRLLSRGGNLYTRLFLGSTISDYTGGYNMYSCALLEKMHIQHIRASGYGFLIELKYRALKSAAHTTQIPIVFLDRTQGTSKIPKSILFQNLLLVLRIKFGNYLK